MLLSVCVCVCVYYVCYMFYTNITYIYVLYFIYIKRNFYRSVTSHLQRIKSRRADIPNPEIPVRIHLSLEKVPDLIKGLCYN